MINGHPDWPVPLEWFLQKGKYKGDYAAIIHYDELFFLVGALGRAIAELCPVDKLADKTPDDQIVVLHVPAGAIKLAQLMMKGIERNGLDKFDPSTNGFTGLDGPGGNSDPIPPIG